jgi:3-oxoacyl-[acyl-carrier protein] reductase
MCARGADDLDAAVRAVAEPGRAVGVVADVTTPDGAAAIVDAAVEQFGGIDIVVNCVGGSGAKTFDDMDGDDLQTVLGRNLFPALNVSRAALPVLRARGGGVIAMITSIWGREGGGGPSYNVAKAAEISLAKAMAGDLAKDGIRVFSVAPGSTLFPGGSWERRLRDDPEGMAGFIERELPWGRLGTVDEIADAVTFLVSPRASWVVGTCVTVDGGQSRSF